ncbi:chemotaxis protein CheX [Deferrisoma palaeochoriense]
MKAEYVNAFLVPSVRVLEKMARTQVRVGKPRRVGDMLLDNRVSILIGLQGRLNGSVLLTAPKDVALAVCERMLGGPAAEAGDVRAVLAELANTIVGNATGHLYDLGIREGITPPAVMEGPEVSLDFGNGVESVLLPLETEAGRLDLVISLAPEAP